MPAYNFKPDFADAVETGEKRLTLRRPRAQPARHAVVGEVVTLWTGLRTTAARRLGVGVCVLRAGVQLCAGGVACVWDQVAAPVSDPLLTRFDAWLAAQGRVVSFADATGRAWADDFARLDGFERWAQAWAFHAAGGPLTHDPPGLVSRDLVGWLLVPADQVAQFLDAYRGADALELAA